MPKIFFNIIFLFCCLVYTSISTDNMATTLCGFDLAAPSTTCTIAIGSGAGAMGTGAAYSYKVTYVTSYGETTVSAASNSVTTTSGSMSITAIPLPPGNVIQRNLYRTAAGGSTYLLLVGITDPAQTTYTDIIADGSLGAAVPAANTASSLEQAKGILSLSNPIVQTVSRSLVAGPAATQATATLLPSAINIAITVAAATGSFILPVITSQNVGSVIRFRNNGANSANIYPAVGQQIDAAGTNVAVAVAAGNSATWVAVATGPGLWNAI